MLSLIAAKHAFAGDKGGEEANGDLEAGARRKVLGAIKKQTRKYREESEEQKDELCPPKRVLGNSEVPLF